MPMNGNSGGRGLKRFRKEKVRKKKKKIVNKMYAPIVVEDNYQEGKYGSFLRLQ